MKLYICILHNVNIKIYIQIVSNYIPYIPHWRQHPKRPVSLPCRSLSWSGCGTAWCMKTMSKMHCPWAWMPREVLMHLRRVKHWNLSACRCCDPSQGDISWVTLLPDYSSIYVPNKSFIIFNIFFTSSTAQGGGVSFKNRKPIGEVGFCESGMAKRIHWWTERCLRSPLCLSLSLTIYLSIFYVSTYLSSYLSLSFSLSSNYLSTYLPIYLSN